MKKRSRGWRVLPHTAEIALEIRGASWPSFFRNAALGLFEVYGLAVRPVDAATNPRKIKLGAANPEQLLVDWIDEIVYLVSTKHWRPGGVRILEAGKCCLRAELAETGEESVPKMEIKAATFSDLKVHRRGGNWTACVVLDV